MERLTFSDAGPADWPYLLCLWWRNVRATHGFVAEDYLRAIGAALPGVYLPAMERVRLAWLEVAPAEGDGSDHASGAGEGHFPTGTVAVPRSSQGRLPAGFLVGRSPLDGAGQPYPLLHLRRVRAGGAGTGQTA